MATTQTTVSALAKKLAASIELSNRIAQGKRDYAEYLETHASHEELMAILGPGWAVARKTANNLARYQNCITPREYEAAEKLAISRRRESREIILRLTGKAAKEV
jgi:hypothetical protein